MANHDIDIRNPHHAGPNLSKVPHPYTSLSYPNQHYMSSYPAVKDEMHVDPKNAVGIPIPASKPKIWSLADTAACKTPPPIHSNPGWSTLQHNNRPQGIGPMSMGLGPNASGSNNCGSLPINMQSLGSNTIINNFACSPYNRYGGFLPGNHQLGNNIGAAHSSFMNMVAQQPLNQILNHSYEAGQLDSDHGGNNQMSNSIRNLHQQHGLGFPEIQTDTPPQTPPNQKHPCNTTNNMLTPSVSHANVTCFSNNNNIHMNASNTNLGNSINQNSGFSTSPNSNSYADNFSQMPQNSPQQANVKNAANNSNPDSAAFKPFFKR